TRPGPSRLVVSLQLKSGIERALRNDIPELRGVEAVNLPPYSELGWDQPNFKPVELPVPAKERRAERLPFGRRCRVQIDADHLDGDVISAAREMIVHACADRRRIAPGDDRV